jgi:hypothetical protein
VYIFIGIRRGCAVVLNCYLFWLTQLEDNLVLN